LAEKGYNARSGAKSVKMESPGARLKKIRLQKGLSLEEVHKKTKIHLNILKAIEEDSVINLSPVYKKGFVKIYCKFLGVDSRDYISDYKVHQQQSIVKYVSGKETGPLSFIKTASIKFFSLKPHIKIKTVLILVLIFIVSAALFFLGKVISYRRSQLSGKAKLTEVIPPKVEKKAKNTATQKKDTPTVIPKPQAIQENRQKETIYAIKLGIHAREDCFIQLKTDGKIQFQNILKKGRSENWQAKDKMELSLGNAGVVELEVNGKIIASLGKRGQARKNILITKEGLSVR